MLDQALTRIRIVLVEPAGALNVGSVARVMKNMGLQQLVLVNPECDHLCDQARHMAVHAVDRLETATVFASLPEALHGCQLAIATTARERSLETPLELPRNALPGLLETPSALIFGPEYRGLSNSELNYAQRFIRIPSSSAYPSLNLAQAVAVCCYELYQLANATPSTSDAGFSALSGSTIPSPEYSTSDAPLEQLEGYYQQLETLLLKIGYLLPHTAASRMEKFRRLFNRTHLSKAEVAMLRGILSQVEYAINSAHQSETVDDTLIASPNLSENAVSDQRPGAEVPKPSSANPSTQVREDEFNENSINN